MLKSKVFFCIKCDIKGVCINREGRETRPQPRVRRAKLGLLSLMQEGRVPGQSDRSVLCHPWRKLH